MSQIAAIGNLSTDELKQLLALGPAREVVEKRFGLFSKKRIDNPTLMLLTSRLNTCTVCSGSAFVHISETVESLMASVLSAESKTLSDNTGSWVEVYAPAEVPRVVSDLRAFSPDDLEEEERALLASGVDWFIAHAEKCTSDQVCVFCVS